MTQATASHAPAASAHGGDAHEEFEPSVPLTTGKLAMWLFLATEIMFFTGLIGSYIVLRFGAPHWPTPNSIVLNLKGEEQGPARLFELKKDKTTSLIVEDAEGKERTIQASEIKPLADGKTLYKHESPLAIGLTAFNTFLLICSSVSMVLALAALQKNDQTWFLRWLLVTVLVGATFVGIQVVEYRELIHHGFTPATNLFASCFYVMTGCHGAHVTGGVIYLFLIFVAGLRGKYSAKNFTPVEIAGLYWHFVDLVWIILFTVVYLI